MAVKCSWHNCVSTEITHEVGWNTNCRACRTEKLCARHARRIVRREKAKVQGEYTCEHGVRLYYPDVVELRVRVSVYEQHRQAWLDGGGLACKDMMVAAVTLTEPPEWDVYRSIMADPPVPARQFSVARWQAGAAAWVALLTFTALVLAGVIRF